MTPLPSPQQVFDNDPLEREVRTWIDQSRQTIANILAGHDDRLLVILGPCSIHDLRAAEEYAWHLSQLQKVVGDRMFLVMRTYVEKARSRDGWKGFAYDPHLDGTADLEEGIFLTRSLLLSLARQKIPTGAELLHPLLAPYYSDLLSWGSVGARTVTSQPHRELAASLPLPVGIKNGTSGSIEDAINALVTVRKPHRTLTVGNDGTVHALETAGNPACHLVLRGGAEGPNWQTPALFEAQLLLRQNDLPEHFVIDCSHDNSRKKPLEQRRIFQTLVTQRKEGNRAIRGMMLESFLYEGRQCFDTPRNLAYGVSITDSCLSWQQTADLLHETLSTPLENASL